MIHKIGGYWARGKTQTVTWRGNTNGGAAMAVSDPLFSILVLNGTRHFEPVFRFLMLRRELHVYKVLLLLYVHICLSILLHLCWR
ncbi:hypothetical protein HanRHA438_Chr03g0105411 [Helianthus annuus]|nr:hypothetical protein HanIR_Chr03g0102831 [Helianthus annuus]KAJ0934262.1 hypothetical protein HanRHA438_Chr03g0105411 [Helianthus annuus]